MQWRGTLARRPTQRAGRVHRKALFARRAVSQRAIARFDDNAPHKFPPKFPTSLQTTLLAGVPQAPAKAYHEFAEGGHLAVAVVGASRQ